MSFADRDQEDRIDPMIYVFPRWGDVQGDVHGDVQGDVQGDEQDDVQGASSSKAYVI